MGSFISKYNLVSIIGHLENKSYFTSRQLCRNNTQEFTRLSKFFICDPWEKFISLHDTHVLKKHFMSLKLLLKKFLRKVVVIKQ